jgi:hypothetical protein
VGCLAVLQKNFRRPAEGQRLALLVRSVNVILVDVCPYHVVSESSLTTLFDDKSMASRFKLSYQMFAYKAVRTIMVKSTVRTVFARLRLYGRWRPDLSLETKKNSWTMGLLRDVISSKNSSKSVAERRLLTVHMITFVAGNGNLIAKTEVTKKMQRNMSERTTMELRGRSSSNPAFLEIFPKSA